MQWKIPVAVSLAVVWVSLDRAAGPAWASAAVLVLLTAAVAVWLVVRRRR